MAKIERILTGDFYSIIHDIDDAVLGGSVSATLEDESFFNLSNGNKVAVRVYERYSFFGGNRVSMSVLVAESEGEIHFSAITSGGSQAVFFKINTLGEEAFLDQIRRVADKYAKER